VFCETRFFKGYEREYDSLLKYESKINEISNRGIGYEKLSS